MGTELDDQIMDLVHDGHGNLYVTGYEGGRIGLSNIPPDGDARAFVAKHDSTGALLWKRILDTPDTDVGEGLAIDPIRGDVYVVGRTRGAFPGFHNHGQTDAFVAVLGADGEVKRIHQTGTERPEHPVRIALSGDGRVVVAGYDDTYVEGSAVYAWEDGFVLGMTIDPDAGYAVGDEWWSRSESDQTDFLFGIAAEPGESGGVYVSGSDFVEGAFVARLDAHGQPVWRRTISPHPADSMNAVTLSPDGRLFVAGATFLTLGEQSHGQQDVVVVELDKASGETRWIAQHGSSETDWPTAIALDTAGNVHVAGLTFGSMKEGVQNQGDGDLFALTIAPSGEAVSVWQHGTPAEESATSLAVGACGEVFVAGYTGGEIVPGQGAKGRFDLVLLKPELAIASP
jgi:hypothetical protein